MASTLALTYSLTAISLHKLLRIFFMMKKNVGMADSAIRISVAILLSVLYFTGVVSGTLGTIALVAGGIFLVTGLLGTCPMYKLFKINTCSTK